MLRGNTVEEGQKVYGNSPFSVLLSLKFLLKFTDMFYKRTNPIS